MRCTAISDSPYSFMLRPLAMLAAVGSAIVAGRVGRPCIDVVAAATATTATKEGRVTHADIVRDA